MKRYVIGIYLLLVGSVLNQLLIELGAGLKLISPEEFFQSGGIDPAALSVGILLEMCLFFLPAFWVIRNLDHLVVGFEG